MDILHVANELLHADEPLPSLSDLRRFLRQEADGGLEILPIEPGPEATDQLPYAVKLAGLPVGVAINLARVKLSADQEGRLIGIVDSQQSRGRPGGGPFGLAANRWATGFPLRRG